MVHWECTGRVGMMSRVTETFTCLFNQWHIEIRAFILTHPQWVKLFAAHFCILSLFLQSVLEITATVPILLMMKLKLWVNLWSKATELVRMRTGMQITSPQLHKPQSYHCISLLLFLNMSMIILDDLNIAL